MHHIVWFIIYSQKMPNQYQSSLRTQETYQGKYKITKVG